MKKIILSLCIAIVATLSATYVNANRTRFDDFYGRTLIGTYVKITGNYESTNCVNFTGQKEVCGYELLPEGWGIVPYTFTNKQAQEWIEEGYLRPLPGKSGIYVWQN